MFMIMSPILLILISLFIISKCDIIWNDPLSSANGSPVNWTITNNAKVAAPYNTTDVCPANTSCWEFMYPSSAYHIESTLNYYNLSLSYYVSAFDLDGQDECNIYYSIDSTTNWIQIGTPWKTNTKSSLLTINLPADSDNNTGVGIRLEADNHNANTDDYCYFSNITLEGILVANTEPPTTNTPTTQSPTTDAPTTQTPTTQTPTTDVPTLTSSQYTSQSAVQSTTPSAAPSAAQSTTDTADTTAVGVAANERKDDALMLYVYIGAGAVFILLVGVICITFCVHHKRKQRRDSTQNAAKSINTNNVQENNITGNPEQKVYGNDGRTANQQNNKIEHSKGYMHNSSYQAPMSLATDASHTNYDGRPIAMSLPTQNYQRAQSVASNPSNVYPQTLASSAIANNFGSMMSASNNNVGSMYSNACVNNSYQQPMSLTNNSYPQSIAMSLNQDTNNSKLEMVAINSGSDLDINNNGNESSDDSVYRKQLQYAYEEEQAAVVGSGDGDGDGSPLPGFEPTLNQQVTSQEMLMHDIVKDMNKSQMKLEVEKEKEFISDVQE